MSLAFVLSSCGPLSLERDRDAAAPSSLVDAGAVLDEFGRDAGAPVAQRAPRVQLTMPAPGTVLSGAQIQVAGSADDDRGVASVSVRIGPNQPLAASSGDGFRSFSLDAAAPGGVFDVRVIARDLDGVESEEVWVSVLRATMAPDDGTPSLTIETPADGTRPPSPLALVRGTAGDDRGVMALEVRRNGELLSEREIETSDFFAHWARLVPLVPGVSNQLTFTAHDASGHEASARLTLIGPAQDDRAPPTVALTSPNEGAHLTSPTLVLRGGAGDDLGVREVKVRIGSVDGAGNAQFGEFVPATTSDGFGSFTASLSAPSGALLLEVRAIDLSGLATTLRRSLVNDFVSEYAGEVAVPLRLTDQGASPSLTFALTRQGIDEIFTEAIQRDTRLLELETTGLITAAVEQIKTSCGTRWRENNPDPRHDCSATSYGKDRTPVLPWQRTPEYAMVRILTMTPANVVVAGTSLENLQGLADALGIGGGFHDILADTLGIPATQEIVSTASVVRALQTFWMEAHPEVLPGAKLPITLYDSMHELSPLAERFGARAAHPGLLDPAFPPRSELLSPSFQMKLVARSNLRWLDGVDASGTAGGAAGTPQKDYLAVVVDTTGPSFDDVLEFDFNDPARFDVTGLVERPRVDMRMLLRENGAFVRTCTAGDSCRGNLPDARRAGYVWANPRYEIESTVAGSAYYQYQNRRGFSKTYSLLLIPAAVVTVGHGSNPAGWSTYDTLLNLGSPPPPQYLWETISEVAQRALHRLPGGTTLAEGEVNVGFTLHDVDVGLSAAALRSAMRPRLQEQRHTLSARLLGNYETNNGAVDFFYRRGADGKPYVYFVAAGDPRPVARYAYEKPGFFAEPTLTTKLSKVELAGSGDSTHEKLALAAGETTVYMQDDTGSVYRLRFVVASEADAVELFVARKVR